MAPVQRNGRIVALILLAALAGCGGGSVGPSTPPPAPPPPPPPPPPPAGIQDVVQVIPAAGGTLSITAASHPYNGLTLTVPAGSFPTDGTWRIGVDSTVTLPDLPTGAVQVGPALVVTTDHGRAGQLLTLKVPIPAAPAGAVTVLVMRDPARATIELPLLIRSDAQSITVAGAHFNGSLLAGPAAASFRASGLAIGQIFPVQLPAGLLNAIIPSAFSALRDLWPAPDAGSGSFPDGHGVAAPILSFLSQLLPGASGLAALVKPMGAPGRVADTASFASLLRGALTYQRIAPTLGPIFAGLANIFGGLTPAGRDSLTSLNLRAAMLLTRRAQLMVLQSQLTGTTPAFGESQWALAVGASPGGLSISSSTSPGAPTTLPFGSNGFLGALFRNVLDAANRPAGSILPTGGSFVLPLEDFASILPDLAAARAAKGPARGVLARALAVAGGMPDLQLRFKPAAGALSTPLASDTVIARDDDAAIELQCASCPGGTADVAIVDTTTRAEIGRSSGGGSIRLGGLPGLGFGSLAPGALKLIVGQALSAVPTIRGLFERMLIPFGVTVVRLPFTLGPRLNLAVGDTARYTTRVGPRTGESWQIEWDWGDGTPLEIRAADSIADHRYLAPGTYTVTATLRLGTAAPLPVAARSTGTVAVGSSASWRFTAFTGPITSPVPNGWASGYGNALITNLYGRVAGNFATFTPTLRYAPGAAQGAGFVELMIPTTTGGATIVHFGAGASCDPAAPNTFVATGGNTSGTFTALRVVSCADQGKVAWEELTVTKSGATISGTLVVTVRDYTYDLPNQKGYRALQDYAMRYDFAGQRIQ